MTLTLFQEMVVMELAKLRADGLVQKLHLQSATLFVKMASSWDQKFVMTQPFLIKDV